LRTPSHEWRGGDTGAGSVIDWWKKLDDGSKKFLMTIGAILIAWRLLNSAFLKSPIGLITTLILAIGLLYDDYQTWKEGGKSLIDWSKWQPEIEQAKKYSNGCAISFWSSKTTWAAGKIRSPSCLAFWPVRSWSLCSRGSGDLSPVYGAR
jgi:hypothetical protein